MVAGPPSSGWHRFPAEPATQAWAVAAWGATQAALADPAMAHWFRHGRTWFVGVDALTNDAAGGLPGGPPLSGAAVAATGWAGPWHRAQLSVVFPGYPGRDPGETDAAHRFRRDRDAAHLDGLIAEGPEKRRFLREPHAFILGIGLNRADAGASPLVVWEGSHEVMRAALTPLAGTADADLTDMYLTARRRVLADCPRIAVPLRPGEAVLLHRLAIHGVAPWAEGAQAEGGGRAVAYFRPILPGGAADWLALP